MGLHYTKDICTCHGKERFIVKKILPNKYCHEGNQTRLKARKEVRESNDTKKPRKSLSRYRKPTGEKVLFDMILFTKPNISFVSGKKLTDWDKKNYQCCMHVLAKGGYPSFRLNQKNIVFGTAEEHRLFDQGTELQRQQYQNRTPGCDWQKLYDLKEQLRIEYNKAYRS